MHKIFLRFDKHQIFRLDGMAGGALQSRSLAFLAAGFTFTRGAGGTAAGALALE